MTAVCVATGLVFSWLVWNAVVMAFAPYDILEDIMSSENSVVKVAFFVPFLLSAVMGFSEESTH